MLPIEKIHNEGCSFFIYPFKVYYLKNEEVVPFRLTISVPKKIFKSAVKRNLIRRRTREAVRLNSMSFPSLSGNDILLVYVSNKILEYDRITDIIKEIMAKIS